MKSGTQTTTDMILGLQDDVTPKLKKLSKEYTSLMANVLRANTKLRGQMRHSLRNVGGSGVAGVMGSGSARGSRSSGRSGGSAESRKASSLVHEVTSAKKPGTGFMAKAMHKASKAMKFAGREALGKGGVQQLRDLGFSFLAKGGLVRGQIASVLGEKGPELVMPLHDPRTKKLLGELMSESLNQKGTAFGGKRAAQEFFHKIQSSSALSSKVKGADFDELLFILKKVNKQFGMSDRQLNAFAKNLYKSRVALEKDAKARARFSAKNQASHERRKEIAENRSNAAKDGAKQTFAAAMDHFDITEGGREVAQRLGISMKAAIGMASDSVGRRYGVGVDNKEAAAAMQALVNEGMRKESLTRETIMGLSAVSERSGMEASTFAPTVYRMISQLGISPTDTLDLMAGLVDTAQTKQVSIEELLNGSTELMREMAQGGVKGHAALKALRGTFGATGAAVDSFSDFDVTAASARMFDADAFARMRGLGIDPLKGADGVLEDSHVKILLADLLRSENATSDLGRGSLNQLKTIPFFAEGNYENLKALAASLPTKDTLIGRLTDKSGVKALTDSGTALTFVEKAANQIKGIGIVNTIFGWFSSTGLMGVAAGLAGIAGSLLLLIPGLWGVGSGGVAAGAGIAAIGTAGTAGAAGLGMFAVAALAVGGAIALIGVGIGQAAPMLDAIGRLVSSVTSSGAGMDIGATFASMGVGIAGLGMGIATGISAIAMVSAASTVGGMLGLTDGKSPIDTMSDIVVRFIGLATSLAKLDGLGVLGRSQLMLPVPVFDSSLIPQAQADANKVIDLYNRVSGASAAYAQQVVSTGRAADDIRQLMAASAPMSGAQDEVVQLLRRLVTATERGGGRPGTSLLTGGAL